MNVKLKFVLHKKSNIHFIFKNFIKFINMNLDFSNLFSKPRCISWTMNFSNRSILRMRNVRFHRPKGREIPFHPTIDRNFIDSWHFPFRADASLNRVHVSAEKPVSTWGQGFVYEQSVAPIQRCAAVLCGITERGRFRVEKGEGPASRCEGRRK